MLTPTHKEKKKKTATINLRTTPDFKEFIEYAARAANKNVSSFIHDALRIAAENTLLDQRFFVVDEKQWEKFNQALEKPIPNADRVKKLLESRPVWERARN